MLRVDKILYFLTVAPIFLFAQIDNYEPAITNDDNTTLKSKNRDGYMPNIITPDYLKSGIYGGLGLGVGLEKFEQNGNNDNNSLDLSLIAGYNINSYIAAESRAIISIANDNSIDYKKFSIFLKPQYEIYKDFKLYSLIGFGKVKANSINSNKTYSSKTSAQLGFGANYNIGKNFTIFADYTYLGKDKRAKYENSPSILKSSSIMTGVTYDF